MTSQISSRARLLRLLPAVQRAAWRLSAAQAAASRPNMCSATACPTTAIWLSRWRRHFPDPPSFDNSFTNGPVAVQLLAESLGLSANASLWLTGPAVPAGTNYAVGGATAALRLRSARAVNINLPTQVGAYSLYASDHADPNALYVVMIGGNDVRNAASGAGASAVTAGVQAELAAISTLSKEDVKHFLVVNVPNVGLIPQFTEADPPNPTRPRTPRCSAKCTTRSFLMGLAGLGLGATLTEFDLYDFNTNILANAAALGFTNTTDPCYSGTAGERGSQTLDAAPPTSTPSYIGTTFIQPPGSMLCGPRASGARFPSPRPGRCWSSVS